MGPSIHESVEKSDAKAGENAILSSITVEPTVGEGSSMDTAEVKTIGDSVVNTGDATVETVLASLVDTVMDTATADISEPMIPSAPTVLMCPTVGGFCIFILRQNECVRG